ncbi:MAG: biopolymer transporter ExbD [Pirellulaceae bacterium]
MPLKTYPEETAGPNLTPMIDILFLLIIFFMVGSKFTELERSIDLDVPRVSDAGTLSPAPEKRVVNIHRDGRVSLGQTDLTLDELRSELVTAREEYRDLGVLVRGDSEVPFDRVANVLNSVRQAGISEMGISVRLETQRR